MSQCSYSDWSNSVGDAARDLYSLFHVKRRQSLEVSFWWSALLVRLSESPDSVTARAAPINLLLNERDDGIDHRCPQTVSVSARLWLDRVVSM